MNKGFIHEKQFAALLESAGASSESREKVWFTIANRFLQDWDGVSYLSLRDSLTPGQAALVFCAEFHRGAAYDFITRLTQSELPNLTLKAFETLQALEYLDLLRAVQAVFPGKKFPEDFEDMLKASRKLPDDYFEKIADKFVTGKGMKRPLRDYIFEYLTAHPTEFCHACLKSVSELLDPAGIPEGEPGASSHPAKEIGGRESPEDSLSRSIADPERKLKKEERLDKPTTSLTNHSNIKAQPGFPHKDTSWLFGLIAVRAALVKIKALARTKSNQQTRESHAFQLKDSDYSILSWDKCEPEFPKWLSKKLKTTVAYLWDEDTSGWFGYAIFKDGAELEVFEFGANYNDELGEFAEELSQSKKRKKDWDVFVSERAEDFQFRSKVTKVTKKDLLKGFTFVDTRFKALGIPIPPDFPENQEVIVWPIM